MATQTIFYDSDGRVRCVESGESSAVVHGCDKALSDTEVNGELTTRHAVTVVDDEVTSAVYHPHERSIEQERADALRRTMDAYNTAIAPVATPYPDYERETWGKQEREAVAYTNDNTSPCPLLSRIADQRGLTLDDLVSRVLANVTDYERIAGDATGIRQRLEGEIEAAYAAGDVDALQAIDWP